MTAPPAWLASPEGAAAIAAATSLSAADPLAAATALRTHLPSLSPDQASAALTQAHLRRTAAERYGLVDPGLLTRDGLEQASRPEVARIRAELIAAAAPARVVDATAGLGFDTLALARALGPRGVPVIAIERDPQTAAFLRVNAPDAQVLEGDAVDILATLALGPDDIVYVDPARRDHRRTTDGSRAHPERDPQRWSPPWAWVVSLASATRVCAKVSPGFPPDALPTGWCGQWTSWRRTPVEAFTCSFPALPRSRRAVAADTAATLDGDGVPITPIGTVGAWLHEVDPAVVAAGLVDALITQHTGVHRIDLQPHWLSGDAPAGHPLLRSYRVVAELPASPRQMRAALRDRGFGSATVKTRGGRRDAERIRTQLQLDGGGDEAIIVATDAQGRPAAYLVESP